MSSLSVVVFIIWIMGVFIINTYLTILLSTKKVSKKECFLHLTSDICISAIAGVITYLLGKTTNLPDLYLIMLCSVIGHLTARIVYKSIIIDLISSQDPPTIEFYRESDIDQETRRV